MSNCSFKLLNPRHMTNIFWVLYQAKMKTNKANILIIFRNKGINFQNQ